MKTFEKCPRCGNELATLEVEKIHSRSLLRQEVVLFYYYKCDCCKSEFTTLESDKKTLEDLLGVKIKTPLVPAIGKGNVFHDWLCYILFGIFVLSGLHLLVSFLIFMAK